MAQSLKIEVIISEYKPEDKVLSCLCSEYPAVIGFLMLEGLMQELWQKPASLQPTSRRAEHFYKAKKESFNYFTIHPMQSSLVMEEMQLKSCQVYLFTPTDREGEKLDTLGQKIIFFSNFRFQNS